MKLLVAVEDWSKLKVITKINLLTGENAETKKITKQKMSTPSKRQRTPHDYSGDGTYPPAEESVAENFGRTYAIDTGEDETKEEKHDNIGTFPLPSIQSLQLLSSLMLAEAEAKENARNWFCANTAFSKQTCMQRTTKDVKSWTTPFRSGLVGGMTAQECKQTCGVAPGSLSSSSPQIGNPSFLNGLIASMLSPKEVTQLIPTSRVNKLEYDPAQKSRLYLEAQLIGLITATTNQYYTNPKYFLNNILSFLRSQERTVNKFLSYPLLVHYLPRIERVNSAAFWPLFSQLPKREKLLVTLEVVRNNSSELPSVQTAVLQKFINEKVFQFNQYEITHDNEVTSELWKLRDDIFASFLSIFFYLSRRRLYINVMKSPEFVKIIDWYLELRGQEESEPGSMVRDLDSSVWYNQLSTTVNTFDTPPHSPETSVERWLSIFLDRGYYSGQRSTNPLPPPERLTDPLVLALYLKRDPAVISQIVEKDYKSISGLERINLLRENMLRLVLTPNQFNSDEVETDEQIAELDLDRRNFTPMFLYNTLGDIFLNIRDEIPSSQPRPQLYIPPVRPE